MSFTVPPAFRLTHIPGRPGSAAHTACQPARTIPVQCERDIVDAICAARERAYAVRPTGGKGSKNNCYDTDGLSLDLSGYSACWLSTAAR